MSDRWSEGLGGGIALVAAQVGGVTGATLVVFGWRPGVWLLLGSVVLLIAVHLAIGIGSYRDVMRRPWPRVTPLEDDDDDW